MKLKALMVFVLLGALLVSASVGTLSGFHTTSAFSTAISVDTQAVKGKDLKGQTNAEQAASTNEDGAVQPASEETQTGESVQQSE